MKLFRKALSGNAKRQVAMIRTFASFIAKHPDMPAEHRARFLAEILQSCDDLGEALS